jgi:hypothetical protein
MTAPRGRGQIGLTVRVLTGPCAGRSGVVEEADYTTRPAAYRVRFDPAREDCGCRCGRGRLADGG